VRARNVAEQRDRLVGLIAEITGCGEVALDELLERGRAALDPPHAEILPIRQGREIVRVPIASIEWIDAAGDYMWIHASGQTHILRGTMKELEDVLDPRIFQRVHRSTIVNLRRVKSLRAHMNGEYFLTLEGAHELKMSRTYRDKWSISLKAHREDERLNGGTAYQQVVKHQEHHCAGNRYQQAVDVESGHAGHAEGIEQPPADDGADDTEYDIKQHTFSGVIDDLARDKSRDKS
jgi:hypothetical protein